MKRLLLVGGGHAQLAVLQRLALERASQLEIILVTPTSTQNYSGMLPGWIAGHYSQAQCQIDLTALAEAAQVKLELASVIGMDAQRQQVSLSNGRQIEYDLLSLDTGSQVDAARLEGAGEKLLMIKPFDAFFAAWAQIVQRAQAQPGYRLVVVGGGAAGVELALAAQYAFSRLNAHASLDLVVSESGLLQGHAPSVQRRIEAQLRLAGIRIHRFRAEGHKDGLRLSDGRILPADCVLAATGAKAPVWLRDAKLMLDADGYVPVDCHHRSLSHTNVFAAGDVCARLDVQMARSGVHAVHAGPVLAANLLASVAGKPLRAYHPKRRSLYLLACGAQYAVASWGSFSLEGVWVWRWKDWIDRGFIARFSSE